MSDTEETKETAIIEPSQAIEIPPQQLATDTTNWDNKVSTDPNETYKSDVAPYLASGLFYESL